MWSCDPRGIVRRFAGVQIDAEVVNGGAATFVETPCANKSTGQWM